MARTFRLFVLLTLLATATQSVMSRENGQTKTIGGERLVSIEPLSETAGEFCEPVPPSREEMLLAAMQQRQDARSGPGMSLDDERGQLARLAREARGHERADACPVRVDEQCFGLRGTCRLVELPGGFDGISRLATGEQIVDVSSNSRDPGAIRRVGAGSGGRRLATFAHRCR